MTLKTGRNFEITPTSIAEICNAIQYQQYKQICINDTVEVNNFEDMKLQLQRAFEAILPQKSSFEK